MLQARTRSDFFDREIERSFLLNQLEGTPTAMLVIVGPCSNAKSRLLGEVPVEKKKDKSLVTFIDGRKQKFTDAGIMAAALREQGATQLSAVRHNLRHIIKTMGTVAKAAATSAILSMIESHLNMKSLALLPSSVLKMLKRNTPCSINDVIKAYYSLLRLSSSTSISNTRPLPVICIDEANVLMGWHKGGAAMEDDLYALLRFLVKVRVLL